MALESCSHGNAGVAFFQKHISPIDSNRCSNYPSCSHYSNIAFKKHGPVIGWVMTCDRLMRCGRDTSTLSKKIVINSQVVVSDPIEANDFWWYDKKAE
jgi:hypothetical protein